MPSPSQADNVACSPSDVTAVNAGTLTSNAGPVVHGNAPAPPPRHPHPYASSAQDTTHQSVTTTRGAEHVPALKSNPVTSVFQTFHGGLEKVRLAMLNAADTAGDMATGREAAFTQSRDQERYARQSWCSRGVRQRHQRAALCFR